jgi:hypothetical protein
MVSPLNNPMAPRLSKDKVVGSGVLAYTTFPLTVETVTPSGWTSSYLNTGRWAPVVIQHQNAKVVLTQLAEGNHRKINKMEQASSPPQACIVIAQTACAAGAEQETPSRLPCSLGRNRAPSLHISANTKAESQIIVFSQACLAQPRFPISWPP